MIEYSLDRSCTSARGQHTYTCEQNAQILLRLERERQLKKVMAASTGKLVISHNGTRDIFVCGGQDDEECVEFSSMCP